MLVDVIMKKETCAIEISINITDVSKNSNGFSINLFVVMKIIIIDVFIVISNIVMIK